MGFEVKDLGAKKIVGLEIRTSNVNGQAASDIPKLWERFYCEGIKDKIMGRASEKVFAVYTKYEGDFMMPYSLVIGCEVNAVPVDIPDGCVFIETMPSSFSKIPVSGDFPSGLISAWERVWSSDFNRAYTCDFEVYDESFDPTTGSSSGLELLIATE